MSTTPALDAAAQMAHEVVTEVKQNNPDALNGNELEYGKRLVTELIHEFLRTHELKIELIPKKGFRPEDEKVLEI
jgi:hypothetical protein